MAHWEFFLAESDSMETVADITHEAQDKGFQLSMNREGAATFRMPMASEKSQYLNPWEYCLIARKNHNTVWSGPVLTTSENWQDGMISVSCTGWLRTLINRYITAASVTYTNMNEGQMAFNLLNLANNYQVDGVARPTGITAGTNSTTATRTKTFERWESIGNAIQSLTEIESGFNLDIDPETKELNIYKWNDFNDNDEAIFGFNWGPSNVSEITRDIDGDVMKNQTFVVGQFGNYQAYTVPSIEQHGLQQQVITISELGDNDIGQAIAVAEDTFNAYPRVNLSFTPKTGGEDVVVPSLFEDYNIGDKVYLTAVAENFKITNQPLRIFGLSFTIDSNNTERISGIETVYGS